MKTSAAGRAAIAQRFWAKVIVHSGGCWEWTASVNEAGYGRMTAGRGNQLKAHRVSWELHNGPIPEGMCVLHECDNPPCCNPDHLFLGTQLENQADMRAKGRGSQPPHSYGEAHHNAKFDASAAIAIKADQRSARLVAADYGISQMTVYRLRHSKTWKQLEVTS